MDTTEIIKALNADRERLLSLLCPLVDESMLEEMADADYGHDTEEHLAALRRIHASRTVTEEYDWHPSEVLELIRWSEPDLAGWAPGGTGERGHTMRAFACASLLMTRGEWGDAGNSTAAQLIDSVLVLGGPLPGAALQLIAWRVQTRREHEEVLFFLLGALLLLLHGGGAGSDTAEGLAGWLIEEEHRERTRWGESTYATGWGWLLGTTHYDLCHHRWRDLVRRVMLDRAHTPPLSPRLIDIARRISDGPTPTEGG